MLQAKMVYEISFRLRQSMQPDMHPVKHSLSAILDFEKHQGYMPSCQVPAYCS